jgi:thymidylate synthase
MEATGVDARMYIAKMTLDDLLRQVFEKILKHGVTVRASRGETLELGSVLLRLSNPRARLSHTEKKGKVFSGLGELLWYLAGSNDLKFINYYLQQYKEDSEDGKTVYGAYGPRMFNLRGQDQIRNIVSLLTEKPDSRRAVIQLFDAEDLAVARKEIPCTCSLQFMIRAGRLNMATVMRSNDAYLGLSHDVFAFTMIQEILARILKVDLGVYTHFAGSLHIYTKKRNAVQKYLQEGWQPTENVAMPAMPSGDPMPSVQALLQVEASIRRGRDSKRVVDNLDPYWGDLGRLLQVYRCFQDGNSKEIARIRKKMASSVYDQYITQKQRAPRSVPRSGQLELFGPDADLDEG